ncbi:MAG TPA: alpha/beta hydrolase [Chloroflexota bacterium]|nr:alpha/beta hydrolase [Chloroflexota bacterium]
MTGVQTGTLPVPGATIHYKIQGTGPHLLILQGGDGDADSSDALADQLVAHYTVATYDRRGLSRSLLDPGTPPPTISTHGDDAHALLAALTTEPALVVGFSLGALIGLDLAARYPRQVRTLIAHEPPALQLLSDAERAEVARVQQGIAETRLREGEEAAARLGLALVGIDFTDREPDALVPPPSPPSPRRVANLAFFQMYDAPAAHRYQLDVAALREAATTIVPAGGRSSRGRHPYRVAEILADLLGSQVVEFPGGHNAFILRPRAFAERVREVLGGAVGSARLD